MKVLKENWTFGIFLLAFLSLLFVGFSAMLDPIKKDIARIETDTKVRFDRMENDIEAINEKLTRLLMKSK